DELQKKIDELTRKSDDAVIVPSDETPGVVVGSGTTGGGTGGAMGDETIVPGGGAASGAGTLGGTTGGTTTGSTPPAAAVDVSTCLSIDRGSYFRCFTTDINHSFC